jgi:pyridoxamine 5'-phosphate oxidase
MNQHEIMSEIGGIIEESKTAVLATADKEGLPHMRWMTPAVLRDRQGAIYAITAPSFDKAAQLDANPHVEWMFQTRNLSKVINVKGVVNIVDNSSIKSEVLESIGRRLTAFWKLNEDERNLAVLETIIEEATYFLPMQGLKRTVKFS